MKRLTKFVLTYFETKAPGSVMLYCSIPGTLVAKSGVLTSQNVAKATYFYAI